MTSVKWAGPKSGYRSVCYCGKTDSLPKQNVEQFNLSGISKDKERTPTPLVCEYCQIGDFPSSEFPFAACKFCGASPSYHHGRCCMNHPVLRPHSLRSDLGSSLSGNSVKTDKRVGVFVVDSQHSEDYVFKLTYGYLNKSTVGTDEAMIVKTYLEREGFTEWFSKKLKAYRSSQKKQDVLSNLKKMIKEDNSSSNSSNNSSWQQVDMTLPGNSTSPPGNSAIKGEVCLTKENIPYAVADRLTVCKICRNLTHDHCNVIGHQAGDLVCPNVRFKFYPVNIRWQAYEESFPKSNWVNQRFSEEHQKFSEEQKTKVKKTSSASSGTNQQIPAVSGIHPQEKILLIADDFLNKTSVLTLEQRQSIINSVDVDGLEPRQVKSIFESVEKGMIVQ